MKKEFIKKLTFQLIRLKTLPDDRMALRLALEIIATTIQKELGFKVEMKKFNQKGTCSLLIKNRLCKNIKLLLVGHIDVVPGKNSLFQPRLKNGFILGRGALDMKGPLAAMIFSFIELIKKNRNLPLGLLVTSDEEIGGKNGACWLTPKFKKCKIAIIPDAYVNFDIVHLQKAPFHFKIIFHGKSAHASRPWQGESAIEKLAFTLEQIRALTNNKKDGDTIAITQIDGGEALNQIPQEASATIDARLINQPEKSDLIKKVKKICQKNNCNFKAIDKGLLFSISKKSKFVKLWKETAEKKLKRKIKLVKECGASDARFFTAQNIPTIVTSPLGFGAHSDEEHVSLTSLCLLSDIIVAFLTKLKLKDYSLKKLS